MSKRERGVNRREFIAAGSAAALVAGLPPLGALAASKTRATPLSLSVGFWSRAAEESQQARVESAQSIPTGDGAFFASGARFSFRGMHRVSGSDPLTALVDVVYKANDGSSIPFFAFTHAEAGRRITTSSPACFTVPVPTRGTVNLAFRARRGAQAESSTAVSFAVNSAKGALKLNEGLYLFAFASAVDWASVRIADGHPADGLISGSDALLVTSDGRDVRLDYIAMKVELASATTS